jgi:seryl-tRNA synthetase
LVLALEQLLILSSVIFGRLNAELISATTTGDYMLDIRLLRDDSERVKELLGRKGITPETIDSLLLTDRNWRLQSEQLNARKSEQNRVSKEIGLAKRNGQDAAPILAAMQKLAGEIKDMDLAVRELDATRKASLDKLPNIPLADVPVGGESQNRIVSVHGKQREFTFPVKDHLALAKQHELLDFVRGGNISGSGFPVYSGVGAALERALINYFLDKHVFENGFREIFPPFLVNSQSMYGTGQLPKMAEDMYYVERDELYLIPTAEVPITNLHGNEIMAGEELPRKYAAYSACFRREAGSYGKDTKGLLRLHQFNKVEMVVICRPEASQQMHEQLLRWSCQLLDELGLHYRILELASADLSFAAARCFDLEVWAPGEKQWLEVSSVSNFLDFQARRANMRYRPEAGAKPEFVHTLNGSGLATPRIMVALLENGQNADGSITIPEPLRPYLRNLEVIK